MKGRSYKTMYGKYTLGDAVTIFARKGMLVARRLANKITMPQTRRRLDSNAILATLSKIACFTFTSKLKDLWGSAIDSSASQREREMMTGLPWYFKRRTRFYI